MTSTQEAAEREAFEVWWIQRGGLSVSRDTTPKENGGTDDYESPWVNHAWWGWKAARATLSQQGGGAVAPGYKVVPVEPTSAMLAAISGEWHSSRHANARKHYAAMLAAAPPAPQEPDYSGKSVGAQRETPPAFGGVSVTEAKCNLPVLVDATIVRESLDFLHWNVGSYSFKGEVATAEKFRKAALLLEKLYSAAPQEAREPLTEVSILNLWSCFVGEPTSSRPLTNADKIQFARAVIAATAKGERG